MTNPASFANLRRGLVALAWGAVAQAQVPASPLEIKSIAEVESRSVQSGQRIIKLIPADRVAPGDRVIYTLEVRNAGARTDCGAHSHLCHSGTYAVCG